MTQQLDHVRHTEVPLQDLMYAPTPRELRLCEPVSELASPRAMIGHLADRLGRCLDGTYGAPSSTYADGLLEQLTTHVDEHPEDTRATLDALLHMLAQACREAHGRNVPDRAAGPLGGLDPRGRGRGALL